MYHPTDYETLRTKIAQAIGSEKGNELESILAGLENIHRQILINPVTGAANSLRRNEDLSHIVERNTADKNIYVVMIDIDDFGHFNKVYGEETGDKVLKGITQITNATLRSDDIVLQMTNESYDYHLHGEEMLAIYSCHNLDEAQKVAERIRKNVEQKSMQETGHKVTISLGVASWDPEKESYERAQHRADRYMQFAKTEGKNQVYCGETDPLFEFKERFYKPGLLDDLAKKATTMVKSTKGIVGKTATKLYKKLKRFFPEY
jgi:diguanylate cyclase (GGDEF)-like protein